VTTIGRFKKVRLFKNNNMSNIKYTTIEEVMKSDKSRKLTPTLVDKIAETGFDLVWGGSMVLMGVAPILATAPQIGEFLGKGELSNASNLGVPMLLCTAISSGCAYVMYNLVASYFKQNN